MCLLASSAYYCYPSIFFCLSRTGLPGLQPKQRSPHLPLPSHLLHFFWDNTKTSSGQLRDIASPECPRSALGPLSPFLIRKLATGSSTPASPSVLPRMAPLVPPHKVQQSYRPSNSSFSPLTAPMGAPSVVAIGLTATATVAATAWEDTDTHLTLKTSPPAGLCSRQKKVAAVPLSPSRASSMRLLQ